MKGKTGRAYSVTTRQRRTYRSHPQLLVIDGYVLQVACDCRKTTRSAMWLAVVTTGMISELVFILQPVGPTGWENTVTPGGGWLQVGFPSFFL